MRSQKDISAWVPGLRSASCPGNAGSAGSRSARPYAPAVSAPAMTAVESVSPPRRINRSDGVAGRARSHEGPRLPPQRPVRAEGVATPTSCVALDAGDRHELLTASLVRRHRERHRRDAHGSANPCPILAQAPTAWRKRHPLSRCRPNRLAGAGRLRTNQLVIVATSSWPTSGVDAQTRRRTRIQVMGTLRPGSRWRPILEWANDAIGHFASHEGSRCAGSGLPPGRGNYALEPHSAAWRGTRSDGGSTER